MHQLVLQVKIEHNCHVCEIPQAISRTTGSNMCFLVLSNFTSRFKMITWYLKIYIFKTYCHDKSIDTYRTVFSDCLYVGHGIGTSSAVALE